jgi:hypothetical protein
MGDCGEKRTSIRFPGELVEAIKRFRNEEPVWGGLKFGPKIVAMIRELLHIEKAVVPQAEQPAIAAPVVEARSGIQARLDAADLGAIAQESGIPTERLQSLRAGEGNPMSEIELIDLARALGCSTAQLIGDEGAIAAPEQDTVNLEENSHHECGHH